MTDSFVRRLFRKGAFILVLFLLVMTGCKSTEPTAPPLSADVYDASWLVVPVHPSPRFADASDLDLARYYKHVLAEATQSLDGYGQTYSVYANAPHRDTGISADSLYEPVPEDGDVDEDSPQRVRVDVLRALAAEADAQYVLVVDPNIKMEIDDDGMSPPFIGPVVAPGLSIGVSIPVLQIDLFNRRSPMTVAMVWDMGPAQGENTAGARPIWVGLRSALSKNYERISSNEDAVRYGMRSLMVESATGQRVGPEAFLLEADNAVIVYRRDQPTVRGDGFHIDGTDVVVHQKEDEATRIPIHTVSTIRSPSQNRILF
ncbi:MAG: hypothetical protein GVY25_06210 [Bacteroidetes bacterium]|jgi:hypothetical protein|nr:hypothetical protein [Bacteroidota bacterium]